MPAAYQDENGKWYKQCSTTKQVFGPVDTKEELREWFHKNDRKDGFRSCCKEVTNKRQQQYEQENAYKLKEKNRKYYQKNLDKLKERERKYRQENVDKIKETKRKYYQENADKIKHYNQTSAGLFRKYKCSAKKREINFTLTLEWFEEQMTKPEFNVCYFTGIRFTDEPKHPYSRSLERIDSEKGYTPDNVRWVCFKLNSWKADLTLNEVANMFKAMAKHHNVDPHEILNQVS